MTVFKHNKGKLVEQPDEKNKPNRDNYVSQYKFACDLQDYESSLRTYIAEGFAEDELVEEKDLEIEKQFWQGTAWWPTIHLVDGYAKPGTKTRFIARKVTKEEGGKPDELKAILNEIVAGMAREMGVEWCTKMINRINNL